MKRIVSLIMIISMMFCSCGREEDWENVSNSESESAVGSTVSAISDSAVTGSAVSGGAAEEADGVNKTDPSPNMMVTMAKKNKPMLSKKVDQTKKGIELVRNSHFATAPIKGDDGNCYYFRYQKNKKGGKLTFYKNNAIKVCETVLPEQYKKDYYIDGFLKQGEQFWVEFIYDEESKNLMVPVRIKDGKWGNGIKMDLSERRIYYKDCFYSFYTNSETIKITDKKGNTKRFQYERQEKWTAIQAIIDDKLYYIIEEESLEYIVMRCNLDGSKKEELFRYSRVPSTSENHCKLMMEGDYFYLFDPHCGFTLTRIPLYGGEAEKIVATDWYELGEDSIFYLDGERRICRIGKDLKGRQEPAMEWKMGVVPFRCADGHLLVEGYNKEEGDIIYKILDIHASSFDYDIAMNYADEYYWVTENGEVEDTIPGTGLRKKYYEWYEWALEMEKVNGPDMGDEE